MGQWCVCTLAAPWVQLSVSAGNGWPHNAPRHHWFMPISCHFRDCKALLVTSLTHVSGAMASIQTFTFAFRRVVCEAYRRTGSGWCEHSYLPTPMHTAFTRIVCTRILSTAYSRLTHDCLSNTMTHPVDAIVRHIAHIICSTVASTWQTRLQLGLEKNRDFRPIQWKTNRNSYAIYQMVPFPMTTNDP